MALSHKAINNLAGARSSAAADEQRRRLPRRAQGAERRRTAELEARRPQSTNVRDHRRCRDGAASCCVAGTAWLFARESCDGALDYLVVDEAGQLSLADALAAGTARAQPDPARRPAAARAGLAGHRTRPGTGASVLEHLLGEPTDHPAGPRRVPRRDAGACTPTSATSSRDEVYDGRLQRTPGCARAATGAGHRHPLRCRSRTRATRRARREEADADRGRDRRAARRACTDRDGGTRR